MSRMFPDFMKGGRLIGVEVDGKTMHEMSWDEFGAVNRAAAGKYRQERNQLIASLKAEIARLKRSLAKVKPVERQRPIPYRDKKKKNRLSVLGGIGPSGLQQQIVEGGVVVSTERDLVFGAQYSYTFWLDYSLSAAVLLDPSAPDSASYFGGLGVDW